MQPPVSCCRRLTNWWTGVVDQSAKTHTTASTGGRRMRLPCGTAVVGPTRDTQHVVLVAPGRNCSVYATTSLRSPSGHELIATIFHDPQEWEPWVQNGRRHFPSAEESEYTAELCFAIATAASWWAVRVGHAKLYVPRSPSPSCTGHRDHWLDLDPRALREWAMTPLAISLGLRPLDTAEAARVPTRACVEEVLQQGALPPGHVYVGLGNHTHRLPTTKWKSPWQVGVNCTPQDWIPYYVQYIRETLWCELDELEGSVLVCDCPV